MAMTVGQLRDHLDAAIESGNEDMPAIIKFDESDDPLILEISEATKRGMAFRIYPEIPKVEFKGWIGVDLDGTLAYYDGWQGEEHIGPPIPAMLARVRRWLEHGHPKYGKVRVKIMTARVSDPRRTNVRAAIEAWCEQHIGYALEITNEKDYEMLEQWDDRVVQVEANTGRRMDGQPDPEGPA